MGQYPPTLGHPVRELVACIRGTHWVGSGKPSLLEDYQACESSCIRKLAWSLFPLFDKAACL